MLLLNNIQKKSFFLSIYGIHFFAFLVGWAIQIIYQSTSLAHSRLYIGTMLQRLGCKAQGGIYIGLF